LVSERIHECLRPPCSERERTPRARNAGVDQFSAEHAAGFLWQHQNGVLELRSLRFVDSHGERGFDARQTTDPDRTD
jgi:hypothetical protein